MKRYGREILDVQSGFKFTTIAKILVVFDQQVTDGRVDPTLVCQP